MKDFVVAVGLVLVIEGVLSALFPNALRLAMQAASLTPTNRLRFTGAAAAALGVFIVWLVRG